MKKIIIAIIALLSISVAEAQIQSQGPSPRVETIYGPRAGVWFNRIEGINGWEYYLSMATTNQFDDHMNIYLGTIDNAKLSIQWFIDNFELGKNYRMKDDKKYPFVAICVSVFATDCWEFYKEGHAGCARVRMSEFSRILNKLNEQ